MLLRLTQNIQLQNWGFRSCNYRGKARKILVEVDMVTKKSKIMQVKIRLITAYLSQPFKAMVSPNSNKLGNFDMNSSR